MTDDEELDCLSRPPVLFPRDQISPPPKPSSFFNYENLILLIGALLGFIGSILLAFMIARRKRLKNIIKIKEKDIFSNKIFLI